MALTHKQQRFIDLYVIPGTDGSLNATQAYRRAYPQCRSDAAARAAAARLLANVSVRETVDARLAKLAEETGMTAKQAFAIVAAIARGNIRGFLDTSGVNPKLLPANEVTGAAWVSAEVVKVKRYVEDETRVVEIIEYRLEPRLPACVLILKAHGKLNETTVHSGGLDVKHNADPELMQTLKNLEDAINAGADQTARERGVPQDE
jgi:hypothetical protein